MGWEFESRAGAFSVRTVEVKRIGSRQSVLVQPKAYWFKPKRIGSSQAHRCKISESVQAKRIDSSQGVLVKVKRIGSSDRRQPLP